ncbi:MAG: Rrf2 family transcriptional regulator [Synechococcaceae cyanobacterium]|nr:Rrf2 family transcriptional regulator [Synechococcaceae cyanobacterium]
MATAARPRLGPVILGRSAIQALKALMALADHPQQWRSVQELASELDLPAPKLEQLLLRLRRADLLQARRGRHGGYRLALPAEGIHLAAVLAALAPQAPGSGKVLEQPAAAAADGPENEERAASERVALLLERRLWDLLERELRRCTLADLLHDLRSARALLGDGTGLLIG